MQDTCDTRAVVAYVPGQDTCHTRDVVAYVPVQDTCDTRALVAYMPVQGTRDTKLNSCSHTDAQHPLQRTCCAAEVGVPPSDVGPCSCGGTAYLSATRRMRTAASVPVALNDTGIRAALFRLCSHQMIPITIASPTTPPITGPAIQAGLVVCLGAGSLVASRASSAERAEVSTIWASTLDCSPGPVKSCTRQSTANVL